MTPAFPTLYQIDSNGKLRQWNIFIDGNCYFTQYGIVGGTLIPSEPVVCKGKNIGRANETTDAQQTIREARSCWTKKQEREGYVTSTTGVRLDAPPGVMLAQDFEMDRLIKGSAKLYGAQSFVFISPKLDGCRMLAREDDLWSRTGTTFTHAVPHIFQALKPVFDAYPGIVLDGELYNHDLKDDFNRIISCVRKKNPTEDELATAEQLMEYHLYDIQMPGGTTEVCDYTDRLEALHEVMRLLNGHPKIKLTPAIRIEATEGACRTFHDSYVEEGYEGAIVRIDGCPYQFKRSYALLKLKDFIDGEFEVVRVEEGNADRHVVVCLAANGLEFGATCIGTLAQRKKLWADRHTYPGKRGTVEYKRLTEDGKPFHANFKGLRDYE